MLMLGSKSVVVFGIYAVCIFSLVELSSAQNQTSAVTDPSEVEVLNSIFQEWGISATNQKWNVSGELCSGTAIDSSEIGNTDYNPFIKCDCSYDSNTTCHITQLKVYALDVVGVIPDKLWNLTYLTNLNLGQNYLTGSLSPSIGNLTRMQYLSLGINALSGELPRELGLLTDLRVLGIGSNNFSGPLPSELGNSLKLEQLYFDSAGVSGEIPSTFAKLQNVATMRLQGNSFEGSIPLSFANLTSLTKMRISDLSNGSSTLAFIKDMKSLNLLVLRNNNITDSIPSNIGECLSLSQLDLSFNNLTGQIPDSLFNMSSLSYLFLGNNKLTGTLPAQKSSSLLNIDLSYNGFSGSFPSWVNQQNLTINLVANNFTIESSNSRILLAMGLYYYGMKDTSATYATNFLNLIPIVTFIFSTIFGIEKLGLNTKGGKIKVFGAILCMLGALTISLYIGRTFYIGHHSPTHRNIVMNAKHKWARGSLLLVGSCLSYAIWFIVQVKLFKIFPAKYIATMLTCIIASVESAVVGVCIDRKVDAWKLGWNLQLGTIIYSGVLATAATFCLISWAITHKGPSYPPMFNPLALIFVTFLEAFFLGVALSVGSLLGMCLIIAGSYLFLWGRKHEPKSSLPATNIAAIEVVTVVRESAMEVATVVCESAEFQSPTTVRPADSSPIDNVIRIDEASNKEH